MYLNQIPYGSNAYGIEAAAKEFLGKSFPVDPSRGRRYCLSDKSPGYYSLSVTTSRALAIKIYSNKNEGSRFHFRC